MKVLITGGAGFVGSSLSIRFAEAGHAVIALDNLLRRGSELNLRLLKDVGVVFLHGDVRNREDLAAADGCELLIECSAEPSVNAGYGAAPDYLINTNLFGAANCLEWARLRNAGVIFLSSSRVYSIAALRGLPLKEISTRFALDERNPDRGYGPNGVGVEFSVKGPRSLYGTTKLAGELLVEEYAAAYGVPCIVNRFGVVAGPRQMGKVDQGFFSLWLARHYWKGALSYRGFGGKGLQVRDVLHIDDLCDLVLLQIDNFERFRGNTWNVGGGPQNSVSLLELTGLCKSVCGNTISIDSHPDTSGVDIPWYITDNTRITGDTGWFPRRDIADLLDSLFHWLAREERTLYPYFME